MTFFQVQRTFQIGSFYWSFW